MWHYSTGIKIYQERKTDNGQQNTEKPLNPFSALHLPLSYENYYVINHRTNGNWANAEFPILYRLQ